MILTFWKNLESLKKMNSTQFEKIGRHG